MSAMGHSRRFDRVQLTSGLTPQADIIADRRDVSKVPGTDIGDAFETTRQALEFRVDEREKCKKS